MNLKVINWGHIENEIEWLRYSAEGTGEHKDIIKTYIDCIHNLILSSIREHNEPSKNESNESEGN